MRTPHFVMIVFTFLLSAFGVWAAMFWVYGVFARSENALGLGMRVLISFVLISAGWELNDEGGLGSLFAIFALMPLGPIWAGPISGYFGGQVGKHFDGGDQEVEKQALLASVEGFRTSGQHQPALAKAQEELDRYPDDFDGNLLVATIHAEDLRDVMIATRVLKWIMVQPETTSKQIAHALSTLADWQLNVTRDPDAAATTLRQIIAKFPDSRAAHSAEQRVANMPTRRDLEERDKPREPKPMPKFERDLGLKGKLRQPAKKIDPDVVTQELVTRLEQHPNDWDTREKLAHHYIEHYRATEYAIEQLEILIASKFSNKADKCRWLHLVANWQCKIDGDITAAKKTLDRVSEMFPGTGYAEQAERAKQFLRA